MLSTSDTVAIESRIRTIEARTGAQVVVALVARTDRFHGLRWRAFALGAAAAAFVVVLLDLARPDWATSHTAIVAAAAIIGAGLACTVLATFVPMFERLFLPWTRAEAEVQRRATVLFLERELFATPRRNAVLLLAGRFERAMAVIGDSAYRDRIDAAGWQHVVDAATAGMTAGDARTALLAGLDALEPLLVAQGFGGDDDAHNDLPDTPLESDT